MENVNAIGSDGFLGWLERMLTSKHGRLFGALGAVGFIFLISEISSLLDKSMDAGYETTARTDRGAEFQFRRSCKETWPEEEPGDMKLEPDDNNTDEDDATDK